MQPLGASACLNLQTLGAVRLSTRLQSLNIYLSGAAPEIMFRIFSVVPTSLEEN